ncbi:MAG: alpha/beta fold hydrolase [Paracoccaceae bacterium]
MIRGLESARRGPAQGQAKQVVVFLHGYGADGNDLLGLANPLEPHMPDTAFVAPNAPEQCVGNPMGFQWFPIPWLDGSSEEESARAMQAGVADLNAYLDQILLDEGLSADRMILLGFSQGTMMSLHVAPRRVPAVAGVVGFSGRLLEPESLAEDVVARPPVLLLHGDQDEMVPPASMPDAAQALAENGFDVITNVMEGTGHGIDPNGLSMALAFMRDKLGLA